MNMHNRLSIQSPVIANATPILTIVNSYILLVGVCFTIMWDFTWRVSDCKELVGVLTGDDGGLVF